MNSDAFSRLLSYAQDNGDHEAQDAVLELLDIATEFAGPDVVERYREIRYLHAEDDIPAAWHPYRDANGKRVTLTDDQIRAVWHAIGIVRAVRAAEGYRDLFDDPRLAETVTSSSTELAKSRLLGRILVTGRGPTRDKPPLELSGPAWWLLPGGDPYGPGRSCM